MTSRNHIEQTLHPRIGDRLGHVLRDVFIGVDALTRVQFDRPWERLARAEGRLERGVGSRVAGH